MKTPEKEWIQIQHAARIVSGLPLDILWLLYLLPMEEEEVNSATQKPSATTATSWPEKTCSYALGTFLKVEIMY